MAIYARLTAAGVVIETCATDPTKLFHSDLAKDFVSVPDESVAGGTVADGKFTAFVPPTPPAIVAKTQEIIGKSKFLTTLPSSERIAFYAAKDSDTAVSDFILLLDTNNSVDVKSADNITAFDAFVTSKYWSASTATAVKALKEVD